MKILLRTFANKIIVMEKESNWIHPKTITGPPAEGDYFFRRDYINDEFWKEIEKGSHVLFIAPRRVGKTSVMKDLVKNKKVGFLCRYDNIEADCNQNQLFKRIFLLLINELNTVNKVKKKIGNWLKGRGIAEINVDGSVKFISKKIDYKTELLSVLGELKSIDQRVVLFLDEFPEVINAIARNDGKEKAIETLHTIREIRYDDDFSNFILVLAGSIGLDNVVNDLDRPKLINDLHRIKLPALSKEEARQMIRQITKGATMEIKAEQEIYIINKLGQLIPYFIQSMIEECNRILQRDSCRPLLENKDVDLAFNHLLKQDENLKDWKSRLKEPYLTKNKFSFCNNILTHCAHKDKIFIQEIYDISAKWKQQEDYMELMQMLVRDGYLFEEKETYVFLSPLLKAWWKRQHPEYELNK